MVNTVYQITKISFYLDNHYIWIYSFIYIFILIHIYFWHFRNTSVCCSYGTRVLASENLSFYFMWQKCSHFTVVIQKVFFFFAQNRQTAFHMLLVLWPECSLIVFIFALKKIIQMRYKLQFENLQCPTNVFCFCSKKYQTILKICKESLWGWFSQHF